MIRSSRGAALPLRIVTVALLGLVPVLAGCEAGNHAPTLQWHQPTDGTGTQLGSITISNAFILGAPLNDTLAKGQSAGLFVGLVNTGSADKLISITAPNVAQKVTLPGGAVSVPSQQAVLLTGPRPKVILSDLTQPLSGGSFVRLTMTFQNAGSVTLDVPVMPRARYFTTFAPAPAPSATSTKPTSKPTAPASATPTPSPTPS